ncbi:MAG TPA: GTP-binding protein [Pseudomonas sabulinigri]|uniref:CobW/HypB/UreG nucleotide-binding domain-containing protein n=1 Tax=marine sediment metagenome TaxID=412755 RepID=A0A0F9VIF1_9ZZZZ|nr:GTP-binding protein [Halopseudomonas sabulinigri]HEC52749.1 GTP-binding protein [Halopseudomonas sabulinigri]
MLTQIPTHLIAGPLGAGKTSTLQSLLRQRPSKERWALLINEFGQVGLDMALLGEERSEGVSLSEIPGGCLCCVNGLPFQVGLGRLLRKAKPDRLFIEASGLGHPAALLEQLTQPPWQGVLALQPLVMVLDGAALAAGKPLADSQEQALPLAGLLICNKADQLDTQAKQALQQRFSQQSLIFTQHGELDWLVLPQLSVGQTTTSLPEPTGAKALPELWINPADWRRAHQLQQAPFSLGWRMSPQQVFSLVQLLHWLESTDWLRAKGVMHTKQGWKAFNLLPDSPLTWRDSAWRQDNRVELITADGTMDAGAIEQGLRATVLAQ